MKHTTLARARETAKLTQQQLENLSGVDRTRIARMEADPINSNPTVDTVRKLEQALGLKRGTLVFGAEAETLVEQVEAR